MTNEPDENTTEKPKKTAAESMRESIEFVVDMMNNGVGIDPKKVYPPGRYQGD